MNRTPVGGRACGSVGNSPRSRQGDRPDTLRELSFPLQKTSCDLIGSLVHCKGVVKVGQSAKLARARRDRAAADPSLSIFPTNLGWIGLLGRDLRLVAVLIGHASADDVRRACRRSPEISTGSDLREHDWHPELRRRLERYCV